MSRPEADMKPDEPWGRVTYGLPGVSQTELPAVLRKFEKQNPGREGNLILFCKETGEKDDLGPIGQARDGLFLYGFRGGTKQETKLEYTKKRWLIRSQTAKQAEDIRRHVAFSRAGLLSFLPEESLQEK